MAYTRFFAIDSVHLFFQSVCTMKKLTLSSQKKSTYRHKLLLYIY